MRKTFILVTSALLLAATGSFAQKKPLDHSVYDGWQTVSNTSITPDGNVVAYEVNPQEGDGKLYIRTFGKHPKEIVIDRGYRATLLDDGKTAVCMVKPFFKDSRQARIKKKTGDAAPKDSLAIIDLATGEKRMFRKVNSYSIGKYATRAVAISSSDTSLVPKKERGKKDLGSPVLVYYFDNGRIDTLRHIESYAGDKWGQTIAFLQKKGKKRTQVGFYEIGSGKLTVLPDTSRYHSLPRFNQEGTAVLYLQSNDSLDSGSKHCDLYRYDLGAAAPVCLAQSHAPGAPEGWGLTQNSQPSFSHDGKRIFAGIQAYQAPKDTSLVPFETAGLDIWNWDAPELPPMTKKSLSRDLAATCTSVISGGKIIPLTFSKYDRISLADRGDANYALSVDETAHIIESQWDMQTPASLSLVSLADGSRTALCEDVVSNVTTSPSGRYVVYYALRERHWKCYDTQSAQTRILTEGLGVNFWDEEDDHPMLPGPYGMAGWTDGDKDILLYDRYDIWKISMADGKAENLTLGRGRAECKTYRNINTKDREEDRTFHPDDRLLLSVFDNASKIRGLATLDMAKAGDKKSLSTLVEGGFTWEGIKKARKAETYLFCKGNFRNPMDIYRTTKQWKTEEKLSAINPQQQEYNWGTPELFHWNAFDGTRLDGLVYKPDDFDPARKYPVMIYFYEKNSENLYKYYNVAPSRSIINIPFYVSRGYIVFVPDIVYTPGLPGESAYNCIVSGAEALARNPWIDRDNMAIQGQSWGGYQVAYLITRTSLFKAAGAGAPVSNMTSAYGGIRWASGMSRQFQYEQTQSRIGRDLWHGIELYMENSPLFKLPEVTTPVLIMHNDNDGAVPWYQGIEMFMGLRRLGKPAWLLEYNGEEHNLVERRNTKDLSIRLQQFFDHYLKGAPEPAWMKTGVPTTRKGQYFGFENAK